jgi:hypothetical protein
MEKKYKYAIGLCVAFIILAIIGFWNNIIGLSNTGIVICFSLFVIYGSIGLSKSDEKNKKLIGPGAEKP